MRFANIRAVAAALIVLAGPILAQGLPDGSQGTQRLLTHPAVQKELKLTKPQLTQIKQRLSEMRVAAEQRFKGFQNLRPLERQKRLAAFRQEMDKKLTAILDSKQKSRLSQIELQQHGTRALVRPDVAESLRLSPEQRQKVQVALQEERAAMFAAFRNFGNSSNMSTDQREEARQKFAEIRTATDTRLKAVLSEIQWSVFQQMLGSPFKFNLERPGLPTASK
jgi:hypothetical protein